MQRRTRATKGEPTCPLLCCTARSPLSSLLSQQKRWPSPSSRGCARTKRLSGSFSNVWHLTRSPFPPLDKTQTSSPAPSGSSRCSYPRGSWSLSRFRPGETEAPAAQQPGSRRRSSGPPAGAGARLAGGLPATAGRAAAGGTGGGMRPACRGSRKPRPGWRWQPPVPSRPSPV